MPDRTAFDAICRKSGELRVRSADLCRDAAAANAEARALCAERARRRRVSPFLRPLALRGGADVPDTDVTEVGVGDCGICKEPIRAGDSLLYRRPAPVHFDCAYPPAPSRQRRVDSDSLVTTRPSVNQTDGGAAGDHRCGACGLPWRGLEANVVSCPSCGGGG